jgi:hypothetical protein
VEKLEILDDIIKRATCIKAFIQILGILIIINFKVRAQTIKN